MSTILGPLDRIEEIIEGADTTAPWRRTHQRISTLGDALTSGIDRKYHLVVGNAEEVPTIVWHRDGQLVRRRITVELARYHGGGDALSRDHFNLVRDLEGEARQVTESLLMRRNWNGGGTGILSIALVSAGLIADGPQACVWGADIDVVHRVPIDLDPWALWAPPLFASPGRTLDVYFDNVITIEHTDSYRARMTFTAALDHGVASQTVTATKWSWTPGGSDLGAHSLEIGLLVDGVEQQTIDVPVMVSALPTGVRTLAFIGDSNTTISSGCYLSEALAALSWLSVGTQGPNADGYRHDGIGGYSWALHRVNAPLAPGGTINIASYVATVGATPDAVVWLLGLNDCHLTTHTTAIANATALVDAWRAAYPTTKHIVSTVLTANNNPAVWGALISQWEYEQRQRALSKSIFDTFGNRTLEGIYVAPMGTILDPTAYGDEFHPNATGHDQMRDQLLGVLGHIYD